MEWKTAISKVSDQEELVRGYELKELIGQLSFAQAIWLVMVGDVPSPAESRMFEAILVFND